LGVHVVALDAFSRSVASEVVDDGVQLLDPPF